MSELRCELFIFAFNAVWGDYIMPTMFLNDPSRLLGTFMALAFPRSIKLPSWPRRWFTSFL